MKFAIKLLGINFWVPTWGLIATPKLVYNKYLILESIFISIGTMQIYGKFDEEFDDQAWIILEFQISHKPICKGLIGLAHISSMTTAVANKWIHGRTDRWNIPEYIMIVVL